MQDIEIQFHQLLREISEDTYTENEQSRIIAFASSLFNNKFKNKRLASKIDQKIINGHMNDAILKAMASLNDWEDDEEIVIESSGLSSSQVIRKIAQNTKSKWGTQQILNPDLLEYMDFDPENIESEETIENAQQTNEALITPGRGKHRTDFQSQPIR